MTRLKFIGCLASLAMIVQIAKSAMTEGKYRIENVADKLHITTEGGNAAFARIVGENWQNFGEQKWFVEKKGFSLSSFNKLDRKNLRSPKESYFLSPDKYRTNNALSYFQDPAQKYPIPQIWALLPVRAGYQIQNQRTGLCLISSGRRHEILEGKCDQYLRDRHWSFHTV